MLIDTPSLCDKCAEAVHSQGFSKPELLQIFDAICDLGNNTSIDKLNDLLDQPAQSVLARIITRQLPDGDKKQIIDDCLLQIKRAALEQEYEKHRLLADGYERSNDERFMSELMESQRIKYEIKKLYGK